MRSTIEVALPSAAVLTSTSAEEALEGLEGIFVDVLLADLRLSGLDGLELVRRARQRDPDLTCVLVTAYPARVVQPLASKVGITSVLLKPLDPQTLVDAVTTALANRR